MPNSERVLNRKVQVLIKIAPSLFYFRLRYIIPNSENFIEILERESTTAWIPPGPARGKISQV